MKVAELFADLGFNIKNENLGQFINKLHTVDMMTVASAVGLGSVYYELQKITTQALDAALAINNFAVQTGLSGEQMQKWAAFAEKAGATGDDIKASLMSLQDAMAAIKLGGGNIMPFQILGISVDKSPFEVLMKVRALIKDMPMDLARVITSQMGINTATLMVLKNTKLSDDEIERQLFLTDQEVRNLDRLRQSVVGLEQTWRNAGQQIAAYLAPLIDGVVKFSNSFVALLKHSEAFQVFILLFGGLLLAIVALSTPLLGVGVIITGVLVLIGAVTEYGGELAAVFESAWGSVATFFDNVHQKIQPVLDAMEKLEKYGILQLMAG